MATFRYEARGAGGSVESGTLSAASRAEAVRLLADRGETAVRITTIASTAPGDTSRSVPAGVRGRGMTRLELAAFVRELSTAVEAGLPILKALSSLANQAKSKRQRAMLDHLIAGVEGGRSLAEAAAEWGPPFSKMIVSVIRAGEISGRFAEVTAQLADLLERDIELRRSLLSATLYPLILLGVIIVAVAIVVTMIVPPILTAVAGEVARLPFPTRVVQGFADFTGQYWLYLIIAVLLVVLVVRYLLGQPGPRLKFDRAILHTPLLGSLLREVAVARFTRLLGTLTGAGLGILDALRTTRDTLGNMELARVIEEVEGKIADGHAIAEPLERSGYFPSLLVQIVDLGERSGQLESMLLRAADSFDRRTQSAIKLFTSALPPVLILIMAGIVGFVLAAILLPLVELQSALG
jgi:general secretion pathway protein F